MAEEVNGTAPESKKKSKLTLGLIIGATLLLIGSGGYLGLNYFRGETSAAEGSRPDANADKIADRVKSVMNLDAFLVNLADTDSSRFVKVTFRLGVDEAGLGEELAGDPVLLAATRDRIISLLSTKTAEDLLTVDGKDRLRNEVRDAINPILHKGKVVEVFILDFVVQL